MTKVIVTGSSGFIGRYVTTRLLETGYAVISIDCQDNKQDNSIVHITSKLSDCSSVDKCVAEIKQADVMVHLAADISVPGDAATIGNNVGCMLSALIIAEKCNVKHFIYLSSIPVIGEIKYTPIDELHPVHPKTPYHWSKYICEQMLNSYGDIFETITIIRIPSPIGVGMRNNVFLSVLINKMLKNENVDIYGTGSRIQNYIDVRDVAEAILQVVQMKSQGLYLIAGKESISNLALADLCKSILGKYVQIQCGRYPDPEESEKWIISYYEAQKTFGYQPYGIEDTIRWIYSCFNK